MSDVEKTSLNSHIKMVGKSNNGSYRDELLKELQIVSEKYSPDQPVAARKLLAPLVYLKASLTAMLTIYEKEIPDLTNFRTISEPSKVLIFNMWQHEVSDRIKEVMGSFNTIREEYRKDELNKK
jgi:hypothetical protein